MMNRIYNQKDKMQICFTQLQAQFIEKQSLDEMITKSDVVRHAVQDYMIKKAEEKLGKTVQIQVCKGVVTDVKNLPDGWNYLIDDKDDFEAPTNDKYHTQCYETSCPHNHEIDGMTRCTIRDKEIFESHCPFKIVERHKQKEK